MREFNVTTTGTVATVTFPELGNRTLTHPVTVNLALEYDPEDIQSATSIETARTAGEITIVDENSNPITIDNFSYGIVPGDNISELNNDSGFVDSAQVSSNPEVSANTAHRNTVTGNPHNVLKSDVGLGNVDNTSDLDKPVSTAQQTALNLKADISSLGAVATSNDYNDLDNLPVDIDLAQEVYVSKSGNDATGDGSSNNPYLTIEEAISNISDSASTKPYIIKVSPGVYSENPLSLPIYTVLIGSGDESTYIEALNVNADLITLSESSGLNSVTISGVTNTSNCLLRLSNTTATNGRQIMQNIRFSSASNGFIGSSTSTLNSVSFQNIRASGITETAFDFVLNINATIFTGVSGGGTVKLVRANAGCIVNVSSIRTINVSTGFEYVGDARINIHGCDLQQGALIPVLSSSTTGFFKAVSSVFDESLIQVDDISTYSCFINNVEPGEERFSFTNEVSIGAPELGRELAAGEGDSYVRGMIVWADTNGDGTPDTDITASVNSTVTTPYTFAGNFTTDKAIYVTTTLSNSTDKLKFLGIKSIITSALATDGETVSEYWDGSSWVEFNTESREAIGKYLPFAKLIFQRTGPEHVRFNKFISDTWVKNDPISLGSDSYWVRFRCDSDYSSSVSINQIKIHTNSSFKNEDGFDEFIGSARPTDILPFSVGDFQAANNSPANQDVYLSDNLGIGRIENYFINGTVDRVGMLKPLLYSVDTSCPVIVTIHWRMANNGATPDISINFRWAFSKTADRMYGGVGPAPALAPGEQSIIQTFTNPGINLQVEQVFELDISEAISRRESESGDLFFATIERENDGNTSNVAIAEVRFEYTKWSNGGHQ